MCYCLPVAQSANEKRREEREKTAQICIKKAMIMLMMKTKWKKKKKNNLKLNTFVIRSNEKTDLSSIAAMRI